MRFIGFMRIKNESAWIARVIESIRPICDEIHILDDHSTDDTREICRAIPGVVLYESPFQGIDEVRDKTYLLEQVVKNTKGDWIISIDGDEELERQGPKKIMDYCQIAKEPSLAFQVKYLWDSPQRVRVDGVYASFCRPSAFRFPSEPIPFASPTRNVKGFHCSNVPASMIDGFRQTDVKLWHYGYIHRDKRIAKYNWYNSVDPNNEFEDGYRHTVIGDVFPPDSRFRWGGPLQLQARID